MERIAIARAAETAIHGKVARQRLNNGSWDSLSSNKYDADIESLAWLNTETCETAVARWASKKKNYLAKKGSYLDYSFLVNPDIKAYGIAGVKKTDNSKLKFNSVWVGEGANVESGPEDPAINQSGPIDVPLSVTNEAAAEAAEKATLEKSEIKVGEQFTPRFTGTVLDKVKVAYSGKLTSADPSIAKVNEDGTVEGVKAGDVELTLTTADGKIITGKLTVVATKIIKVSTLKPISTESGIAPKLPKTVKVDWDNGKSTDAKITWDKIDSEKYTTGNTAISFTAIGHIDGWKEPVKIAVTVTPAHKGSTSGSPVYLDTTSPTGSSANTEGATSANTKGATSANTEDAASANNSSATAETSNDADKTAADNTSVNLAKTGVAFTFMSVAAALLLLGAGISLRKYASLKK